MKNKKFTFISKHPIICTLGACVVAAFLGLGVVTSAMNSKIDKQQEEIEQEKQKEFSNMHSKMEYIIDHTEEYDLKTRDEAVSVLITHTMQMGCSTSYSILESHFNEASLKYIQDFLTGRPCDQYTQAPVVILDTNTDSRVYLCKLGTKEDRYKIEIFNYQDSPARFEISKYVDNDAIK